MAYVRKTKDIYEIHEYIEDYGWEYSTSVDTLTEAKQQKRCYEQNGVSAKIVKRRERIE